MLTLARNLNIVYPALESTILITIIDLLLDEQFSGSTIYSNSVRIEFPFKLFISAQCDLEAHSLEKLLGRQLLHLVIWKLVYRSTQMFPLSKRTTKNCFINFSCEFCVRMPQLQNYSAESKLFIWISLQLADKQNRKLYRYT